MRIVYFYQYFGTTQGSWSTRVYEFTRRWVEAGDSVTVVTSIYDKSDLRSDAIISRVDVEGVDVRIINLTQSNKHGKLRRLVTFATYAVMSCWYALTLPADVVVASSGPLTVGLPGLVARYIRRRPFVFEVRDLWPEGAVQLGILRNRLAVFLARAFERLCYRSATRIVACSEGQARWIEGRDGATPIAIVPNASDNQLVRSLTDRPDLPGWAQGTHLVLYAGTLGLIDDCRQILDVARVMQERGITDVQFVVIGDGKERPMLEATARAWKLGNVHFLGLMPKVMVMRWLKLATCTLFVVKDVPFLSTASPNKLFDSFAAGAPVVQATTGWIADLIEREGCGLNVQAGDPEEMADAVLRIAREPGFRESLAADATRVAESLFDRDLLAAKMRGVLRASAIRERAA